MKPIKLKKGHRMAIVRDAVGIVTEPYMVSFYYDGLPDFEWKRGSHGIACDLCDTLEQAMRKAKYYLKKEEV